MDPYEISAFKKNIEEIASSENGDCIVDGVMLSYVKNNKSEFPNLNTLNDLLPASYPIIIAHKPFNKNPVVPVAEQSSYFEDLYPKERPVKKPSSSSDVEGSPLKLQTYADFSAFDMSSFECLTPKFHAIIDPEDLKFGISLPMARKLTGIYNQFVTMGKDVKVNGSNRGFLCFCNGEDRRRTACLYTQIITSTEGLYLGLKSTLICATDPVNNNDHLPNLQKVDFSRKQISCRATYDILHDTKEDLQFETKNDYDNYKGTLVLDVNWSRPHSNLNLLHPPPPEATTTIKACVVPGSERSAAFSLFQELSILKSLVQGLKSSEITWLPEEQKRFNIMKSVKDLFENLKLGDAYLKNQETKSKDNETGDVTTNFSLDERKDFDFTDHLWKILSNCTSFQELIDPLKYVFTALSNGELQPMVHRGNNTMVAQLVRDSFSGKLRIPNLAGLYPVELLVEIGIEKLKQDYTFVFLSKDLTTRENLEPFLKSNGDFSAQLVQLEKMHFVIEMISMFQLFLKVPVASLGAVTREMIQHYQRNSVSNSHLFKFIVPTTSVLKNLEGCPPSTWQLESTKLVENIKESVTYLLTSDPPFKHLPVKDNNLNIKEEGNETKIDETVCGDKMKKVYFLVKKIESVSILV